jgi:uncharacterized protein YndB with AHSA1/START domain
MTTPDVPLRMELTFEFDAPAEQVWEAVATANGISSWFVRTDLEEHEGGRIVTHMGPDAESPGTVTGWEPPHRLEYEEPDWAGLTGHDGAAVTPLVSEFIVEAKSGGSCVLRIVSSAFGTGADWEQEFFEEMEKGWRPFFDRLRLYLAHFPGQQVTVLEAQATVPGDGPAVLRAMRTEMGIDEVGQSVDARGLSGTVERMGDYDALLRLKGPVPGFFAFAAIDTGDGKTMAMVQGQLFSADAAAFVDREQPAWQSWVEALAVPAA